MITLKEHIQTQLPEVDLELAKKVINTYNIWRHHLQFNTCAICYKELTPHEKTDKHLTDYNIVCAEHKEYRATYNTYIVRKNLGIEEKKFFHL